MWPSLKWKRPVGAPIFSQPPSSRSKTVSALQSFCDSLAKIRCSLAVPKAVSLPGLSWGSRGEICPLHNTFSEPPLQLHGGGAGQVIWVICAQGCKPLESGFGCTPGKHQQRFRSTELLRSSNAGPGLLVTIPKGLNSLGFG